jgi:hypothetical protein
MSRQRPRPYTDFESLKQQPNRLPRDYAALYALLRARPWLRTELVDTGLESWRRDRSRWFVWRGRKFHISRTALQFRVTDGRHRPLVQRWD